MTMAFGAVNYGDGLYLVNMATTELFQVKDMTITGKKLIELLDAHHQTTHDL